ncbi:hypothetical protein PHLCEN_2v12680 [Hermanssonia centrifuga]|uniref:Uncharacterized protein n=1 Tax=Hermanssonia centrifuga TaxID=98765 RepID=A0A2R6NGD8_9APHY|nr:hypothetical protein PHLCEN_2v12680 [Hermanssonia centrifuga]
MSTTRSIHTHATFPSISSTLSLLEERKTEVEKRSGVLVTELDPQEAAVESNRTSSSESTIIAHAARRSNREALHVLSVSNGSATFPKRNIRPTLNLSTSSPQLRELAELANVPPSPITACSPMPQQSSFVSLATSISSPLASSSMLLSNNASRWSVDSTGEKERRPTVATPPATGDSPSSSAKPRKRDRLISFISRGRAGSLGKQQNSAPSTTPNSPRGEYDMLSPYESQFGRVSSSSQASLPIGSRRPSRTYSITPIASSSSSSSTLPTPADSQSDFIADPFCPASPTFAPVSYLPDFESPTEATFDMGSYSPPAPTHPLPSPGVPTSSFFLPVRERQPSFPFLSAMSRKKAQRRKKILVISSISTAVDPAPESDGRLQIEALRREREQKKRVEGVLRWSEGFGPVKRVENRPDGSLHVHWKDWETADLVSTFLTCFED